MNIYKIVERKINYLNWKTGRSNNFTESIISENEVIVKNNESNHFLALGRDEIIIWNLLSERKTVKDIIIEFYIKTGRYSKKFVIDVIYEFYIHGFLKKKPENIYHSLKVESEKKTLKNLIKKISNFFFQFRIETGNIDKLANFLFDKIFFIFFNKIAYAVYVMASIAGMVLFVRLFLQNQYSIWEVRDSAAIGSFIAIIINLILTSIHEAAHLFATKYFRQKVNRGGLLLYLGLPCFYVDTNEIWLAGRKARLAVSWAGPWSTIIVSSLSTLLIVLSPEFIYNEILYKFAIWGFVGAIINLNPLLELDGYYILIDWLKKPLLRKNSFAYIKNLIRDITFQKSTGKLEWDKITYGILASVWSFISIGIVVFVIEFRSKRIITDFYEQNSVMVKAIGITVLGFWMLPVIISLIVYTITKIRYLVQVLIRAGLFEDNRFVMASLFLIPILLTLIPFSALTYSAMAAFLFLYFISRFRALNGVRNFLIIGLSVAIIAIDVIVRLLPGEALDADCLFAKNLVALILALFGATYIIWLIFFESGLKNLSMSLLSFSAVLLVYLGSPEVLLLAPAFCFIGMVVIERNFVNYGKSVIPGMLEVEQGSDRDKLIRIAGYTSDIVCRILRDNCSIRKFQSIIRRGEKYGFNYSMGRFEAGSDMESDIIKITESARGLITHLLVELRRIWGPFYSYRLVIEIFDSLYWSDREIFDNYLFPEKDLMRLSVEPGRWFDPVDFVRDVPFFSSFSDKELKYIIAHLKMKTFKGGEVIIREGDEGDNFYIILKGEVDIFKMREGGRQHIATLFERDFLGEVALIKKCSRTATAIARCETTLLSMDNKTFVGFVDKYPEIFNRVDKSVRILGFLKTMPFFRAYSERVLSVIASKIEHNNSSRGEEILSRGARNSDFYIIREGTFRVIKNINGKEIELATLVRGEFFGEMLFLDDSGEGEVSASIKSVGNGVLYKVSGDEFRKVLKDFTMLKSDLAVISSRRELENRYRLRA